MTRSLTRVGAALAIASVFLSACGGGGGGSSGNPPAGSTGLIPAAPPLGATLHADATLLRPLVAGGIWTYRGNERTIGAAGVDLAYDNTVRQQALNATAFSETAANADNSGEAQQSVRHSAGEVRAAAQIFLPNGQLRAIDQLELRSPVREGDQYTVLDLHLADGGFDLDGDGRNEALDFAVYTRVMGSETVDLVSYDQAPSVRTRTYALSRARLSSTGAYTDTLTATQDTWYSPRIGVIRRSTEVPGPVEGSHVVTDESLVNWDGLARGVGFLDPRPATTPSGTRLLYGLGAAAFDSHAVIMSSATSVPALGIALSKVDARGTVLSTASYPDINASRAKLVRVSDSIRVLAKNDTGLYLRTFDADGTAETASPVLLTSDPVYAIGSEEFIVASSGDTLWLAWIPYAQGPSPTSWHLQVQPFGANGQPLAPPTVLTTLASPMMVGGMVGVSQSNRAGFAWTESMAGGQYRRYAFIEGTGAQSVQARTLSSAPDQTTLSAQPSATPSGFAMVWRGDSVGAAQAGLRGVSFDPSSQARRSNALDINEGETLRLPWEVRTQFHTVGSGTMADVYTNDIQKLWPEDSTDRPLSMLTELTPGTGPLATDNQARLLARGLFPAPSLVVGLSGNVLTLADEPGGITITSIWRRP